MELGTRLRYGILAMLELARRGGSVPVRAEDIAKAEGISKGYLEGLLATLRRAGLVRAVRGPGGGWVLAKPASRLKPIDVYTALEGPTALVPCVENRALCPLSADGHGEGTRACRARRLWVSMTRAVEKTLRARTLAALAGVTARRAKRSGPARKKKTSKAKGRQSPKTKTKARRKKDAKRSAARQAYSADAASATKAASSPKSDKRRAAVARNREIVKVVKSARRASVKLRRSA